MNWFFGALMALCLLGFGVHVTERWKEYERGAEAPNPAHYCPPCPGSLYPPSHIPQVEPCECLAEHD